ncbi:hypothetical protein [Yersinia mollaretii]|uniref:hypothetical protein n=2 Tax=Yersinia mollaretii TaxID=33060 RepID=UPI00051937AC|nr:hypothetical protein [Yersinia mollaretii]PJE87168.1 hypothetical protein CU280_13755 [Yersinia mollaretii]QKJ02218.1 hypothetical protein HRD69_03970 [Yersinia mollaretii ATCC 43969]CQD38397.1 alpha-related fimbriae minor subunit 1 [Yersinia mollaretii]
MMKKTLLSIITMAIVTSSSAYAAHSVQKDISIEVEIAESLIITMNKADGTPFNSLNLTLDHNYFGTGYVHSDSSFSAAPSYLVATQPVKITALQDTKVEISLAEEFVMHHAKGEDKRLYPNVHIDDEELSLLSGSEIILKNKEKDVTLEVVVQDSGTQPGDKYTGILKLVMEYVA